MNLIKALAYAVAFAIGFIVYTAILCFSEKRATAFEVKWMAILDNRL